MTRTDPQPLKCWDFEEHGGMTIIAGKPNWPDYVQIDLSDDEIAYALIEQIVRQLRHGSRPVTLVLLGKLERREDEE